MRRSRSAKERKESLKGAASPLASPAIRNCTLSQDSAGWRPARVPPPPSSHRCRRSLPGGEPGREPARSLEPPSQPPLPPLRT